MNNECFIDLIIKVNQDLKLNIDESNNFCELTCKLGLLQKIHLYEKDLLVFSFTGGEIRLNISPEVFNEFILAEIKQLKGIKNDCY